MLYFDNQCEFKTDFDLEEVATKVISYIMKRENCPYDTDVSLVIVSEAEIRDCNREFREIDSVTDVLSFPNTEFEIPGDFGPFSDIYDAEHFNPDNLAFVLGDIMLCADRIISQSMDYQHSVLREYAFLIAHSVLHLIGYDHITQEEATIMEEKQNLYLNELKITRD